MTSSRGGYDMTSSRPVYAMTSSRGCDMSSNSALVPWQGPTRDEFAGSRGNVDGDGELPSRELYTLGMYPQPGENADRDVIQCLPALEMVKT